jgi:hypothetical protein
MKLFKKLFPKKKPTVNRIYKIFPKTDLDLLFDIEHSINRIYPKGCLKITFPTKSIDENIMVTVEYTVPNVLFVFGQHYEAIKRIKAL